MNVFAVIPARGGSRRVPNKNVRELAGKPLIAHTIQQTADADLVDEAVVSTDDPDIAAVAEDHGGLVPFERPAELATDTARSPPVVEHALDWAKRERGRPDIVMMLQVTTPLRTATDIDNAVVQLHDRPAAQSIISITAFDPSPFWAVERDDDAYLHEFFDAETLWTDDPPRSQDLPDLQYPNGGIFAARTDAFERYGSFYLDRTLGYEMPPERSVDIDEPADLELARCLLERLSSD
ncbi:cytidylyltransferase domain-containing protein [Halorubrum sp. SD626R]|uniref:acylneuraminate cytidylyltransferase family protein n=1 Tax=Halorubrum sp. SD626R TaxID=1419722 RepID=UPI000AD33B9D|nr:acylneuraminate cytidylyltransferase family protein [Halorubrum sp. SD626R]TKX82272.1 acylneuraminate cytidylyltransferase family protein [Halorubrum sp. SD626R]